MIDTDPSPEKDDQPDPIPKDPEETPLIVTCNGIPFMVAMEIENSDHPDDIIIKYAPKLEKILNESREEYERRGGISHEAFWEEIEKKDS